MFHTEGTEQDNDLLYQVFGLLCVWNINVYFTLFELHFLRMTTQAVASRKNSWDF